ncbi:MAG: ABC transporter substrate-binding protein [Burkholderiales bacterium]|nr:ABC transporter substrate-binding protein [Burkholderiales bacterium]
MTPTDPIHQPAATTADSSSASGHTTSRRAFLARSGGTAAALALPAPFIHAQPAKLKVGMMLPSSGAFAALGTAINNGFKMAVAERGGKIGGREIEYFTVDDESNPAKAPENTNRLVQRDKVDVLVGTVHSGVALGMARIARETGTLLLIPNAGADDITGPMCSPNIFRTSFSNWQPVHPLGKVMAERGHKTAVWISWKYAAGDESGASFKQGFEKAGGKVVKELGLPFPNVEFQPLLAEIAALKPDAVACFFAGAGAAKFVADYAAAGLKDKIPLYGSGFLTDGVLQAVQAQAQGLMTTLHYADSLPSARDKEFRTRYAVAYKMQPDVYAVQGYDTGLVLAQAMEAVKGDFGNKQGLIKAMEGVKVDSPRGTWTMSKAHNPIQDIYLRRVEGEQNKYVSVAWKALADPARGCKLG